ncbi:MAG: ParB/RepB/Spo0J family partition protein [Oscillospiraceae bacterium]|nr:ParB/RepB/Spo0J family partition protein [Oscillospiraceae bacterium]
MKTLFKKVVNKVIEISVNNIFPNPAQPREDFDHNELMSLAASIKENGLLQPLTVREQDKNGMYELISGERRLRAAKLADFNSIPCIVMDKSGRDSAVLALTENIQRQDLNFFEEAAALERLIVEWNITQEEAAARLGKAQSTIANKLRLLKLTSNQRKKIVTNNLTERHARSLIKIHDEQLRDKVIYYIVNKKLNVAQTEEYISGLLSEKVSRNHHAIHIIKDVRLFINTINKAIDIMQKAGVNAKAEKISTENFIEYIVKIPLTPQS